MFDLFHNNEKKSKIDNFYWLCVPRLPDFVFLSLVEVLCSPMLLSTFSHFSLFHMAANMYVLWSFSSSIVNILGQEQFMAMYLSAGDKL